jgi:predicted nuclease with RNAse H fold
VVFDRVLGIDLAAQPERTGVVILDRCRDGWVARTAVGRADDNALVELGAGADVIGVDAPLGWPVGFVDAVSAHRHHERWPGGEDRSTLTYRRTDLAVSAAGWGRPLSAAADRLGIVAMRCALLQREWAEHWGVPAPRDGSGALVETYPAAAVRAWFPGAGRYKGSADPSAAREERGRLLERLGAAAPWLDLGAVQSACVASDDVLDALLCALVALASRFRATSAPRESDVADALSEGWIHVPTEALVGLGDLCAGSA